jgi:hypothetical protein
MTTQILSDAAFYDPNNLIPYIELDDSIVRGATLALLDFSNGDCYTGSGAIAPGAQMLSLTNDRAVATAATALGAVTQGLLGIPSTVASPKLNLPNSFLLPSTCRRFLSIAWLKAPASGWAASGSTYSLIGVLNNTTTTAQWGITLTNSAGTIAKATVIFPISASSAGALDISASALATILDGNLHQLAVEWSVNDVAHTYTVNVYSGGVKIASGSGAYTDASIVVPATTPCIGRAGGSFITTYAPNVYIGRPSLWNLTGRDDLVVANILADDAEAAGGYLS